MSTPFPSQSVQGIGFRPRLEDLMTPRGVHVPSWYDPKTHYDPNPEAEDGGLTPDKIVVTQGGIPLLGVDKKSFTVAEVPIERRWAIGRDGEVFEKAKYREGCHRIVNDLYELRRVTQPHVKYEGDVQKEPSYSIKDYVSMMVDPEDDEKLIPMHYDPHKTRGAVPEQLASTSGDKVTYKPRLDSLLEAYANPATRERMRPDEIAEVRAHFAGLEAEAVTIEPSRAKGPHSTMPCGAEVPNFQAKKHREECAGCAEAK
jgi:hypothetical protein